MKTDVEECGLAPKALDLHVHTPASKDDYRDRQATPADIIEAAINAGLDGICITDHNSAEWVDAVSEAAKGKTITVFPGVEVSVTGGKEGPVHIVGIFEPGRSSEDLNDFLSVIGLTKAKRGKTDEVADGDPDTVINEIAKYGGIPVLAHADSSHGVLHDMKGKPRTKVIQNPQLVAAEVSKERYRKVLDGTDPEYRRSLPTYEASDAHDLAGIGQKRTYFKTQRLSLESLKQCFYDPTIRILRQGEYEAYKVARFPRIIRVTISQGFFQGQIVAFHPCQNTLIGGQGVGKSLLIEFIRFALDQTSSIRDIMTDAGSKLKQQLDVGGKVCVEVELTNGARYEITRQYDGRENPKVVVNKDTGEVYYGEIAPLFPVMAYSQTEAVYIARNPYAQLELIDRFIDAPSFQRRIEETLAALRQNDKDLAEITEAHDRLNKASLDLHTLQEEIANVDAALDNPIFQEKKSADQQKDAFEDLLRQQSELAEAVTALSDDLTSRYQPVELPEEMAANEKLRLAHQVSRTSLEVSLSSLGTIKGTIDQDTEQIRNLLGEWMPTYQEVDGRYQAFLSQAGGDRQSLDARRKRLKNEAKRLEDNIKTLQATAGRFEQVMMVRRELLDGLDMSTAEFHEVRRQKYQELTALSEGKLLLNISQAADRTAFENALHAIATGTRVRKSDLTQIAERVLPREFVELVLNRDFQTIAEKAGVDLAATEKLVGWLNALEAQAQVLALQHQYLPQDVPSIKFRKDDGTYHEIAELSVGQKCTALLIIALSAGNSPIIIDQPEESIDIASVFSDIVSKLRAGKDHRQFILTTHNPNIAVTADSDLIHILRSSATQGQIVNRGVIEDEEVRTEVINHLEGGKEPYLLRGRKYGLLGPTS